MADFNDYKDNEVEGANVNITDPTDPTKKAGVTNTELNIIDVSNAISTPIHSSVGTSAVRIDNPALANRKEVDIQVNKDIYLGFDNTVSSTTYYLFLRKGQIVGLSLGPSVQLWAISSTVGATSDVIVTQGAKS